MSERKILLQNAPHSTDSPTSHRLVRLISHRPTKHDHFRAARLGMATLNRSGVSQGGGQCGESVGDIEGPREVGMFCVNENRWIGAVERRVAPENNLCRTDKIKEKHPHCCCLVGLFGSALLKAVGDRPMSEAKNTDIPKGHSAPPQTA